VNSASAAQTVEAACGHGWLACRPQVKLSGGERSSTAATIIRGILLSLGSSVLLILVTATGGSFR